MPAEDLLGLLKGLRPPQAPKGPAPPPQQLKPYQRARAISARRILQNIRGVPTSERAAAENLTPTAYQALERERRNEGRQAFLEDVRTAALFTPVGAAAYAGELMGKEVAESGRLRPGTVLEAALAAPEVALPAGAALAGGLRSLRGLPLRIGERGAALGRRGALGQVPTPGREPVLTGLYDRQGTGMGSYEFDVDGKMVSIQARRDPSGALYIQAMHAEDGPGSLGITTLRQIKSILNKMTGTKGVMGEHVGGRAQGLMRSTERGMAGSVEGEGAIRTLGTLGGASGGALTGAALDEESPVRGALIGGVAGFAGGMGFGQFLERGLPEIRVLQGPLAARRVIRMLPEIQKAGGATLLRSGRSYEGGGFSVAGYSEVFEEIELTPQTIRRVLSKVPEDANLGIWMDLETRKWNIEASKTFSTREEALREGLARKQKAVWDHVSGQSIFLPSDEAGVIGAERVRRGGDIFLPSVLRSIKGGEGTVRPEFLPMLRNRRGGLGVPGDENLSREQAVDRMRDLSGQGVRAQMQRQPDGSFKIVRRSTPQSTALQPVKPKVPTEKRPPASAVLGQSEQSGYQSRLLSSLWVGRHRVEKRTLAEWEKALRADPEVPKAELEETLKDIYRAGSTPDDVFTTHDLAREIRENSPVARLEVEVAEATGGGDVEIPGDMINEEVDYMVERATEHAWENVGEELYRRDENLKHLRGHLTLAFGEEGASRVIKALTAELAENAESLEDLVKEWDFGQKEIAEAVEEFDRLFVTDALTRRGQLTLPGVRPTPDLDAAQKARAAFRRVLDNEAEAWSLADDIRTDRHYDLDDLQQRARESLEEAHEGVDLGNTKFATYQRVDPEAPYREIIIRDSNVSGGSDEHFRRALTHARGEIHDDTFLLIEVQSDVSPEDLPKEWKPIERRVQLSVGAALYRAAQEDLGQFAWVSAENRMRVAHLRREMAKLIYDRAVPKAVERIFKQLNLPLKATFVPSEAGGAIRLSDKARKRILEMGVPALGVAGLVVASESKKKEKMRPVSSLPKRKKAA